MVIASQVVRGESWARDLQEMLKRPPGDIASWMQQHTRVLKTDAHSSVGLLQFGNDLNYLKFYRCKSPLQSLSFRMGYGRGIRSFDMARELCAASIAVPQSRACLLVRGGMLLLTEGFADCADLKALWLEKPSEHALHAMMCAAGCALAELHREGFAHGDCKWSNFLCCDDRIIFVDLEKVCRPHKRSRKYARDVARFTLNAEDMGLPGEAYEIFLSSYVSGLGRPRATLTGEILSALRPLRRKHLSKYGPRGHRLL